ncbi:MAG: hypothetical protein ACK4N5_01410 [Myxococcales bacterium]
MMTRAAAILVLLCATAHASTLPPSSAEDALGTVLARGNDGTVFRFDPAAPASSFGPDSWGPFSDANYFQLGTGSDVMDFGVGFTCIGVRASTITSGHVIASNGHFGESGWYVQYSASNTVQVFMSGAIRSAGTLSTTAVNTICWGHNGTSALRHVNGSTNSFNEAHSANTSRPALLGRYPTAGNGATGTRITGIYATTTAPTAELMAAQATAMASGGAFAPDSNAVMWCRAADYDGSTLTCATGGTWTRNGTIAANTATRWSGACLGSPQAATGQSITVTRASTATVLLGSSLVTCDAGQLRVDESGWMLVEPPRTNAALRSEEFDTATWTKTSAVAATADVTTAPDGNQTADRLVFTAPATGDHVRQRITVTASTTYVWSAWLWTDSGSKTIYLARTNCSAFGAANSAVTVTTTPTRFALTYTTASGETCSDVLIGGNGLGQAATAGTYYVFGAQHEAASAGPFATSYIRTEGTAVARARDLIAPGNASVGAFSGAFSVGVSFRTLATQPGENDYPPLLSKRPWTAAADKGWAVALGGTANQGILSVHFADGSAGIDHGQAAGRFSNTATVAGVNYRFRADFVPLASVDGYLENASIGSKPVSFAGSAENTANLLYIGSDGGISRTFAGHLKNICLASRAGGCR